MRLLLLLLCPLLLIAAQPGLPLPHRSVDLPTDEGVTWGRLDNGLVYAVMPNDEPPDKLSIRLLVDVGSLQEDPQERGLAHYLEHMAFNGTEQFPPGTLVERLQELGAAFGSHTNAHTGFEETVYKLDLPDTEAGTIDLGLTIMAEWARRLSILPEEVERERGVILAEMRDRDGAGIRTWRQLYAVLYAGRRIGDRFPIGVPETVEAMDAELIRDFYHRWYRPEHMVLSVVGAVETERVVVAIEAAFAGLEAAGESPTWAPLSLEPTAAPAVMVHVEEELGDTDLRYLVVSDAERPVDSLEQRRIDLLRGIAGSILARRFADLADDGEAPIQSGRAYVYHRMDAFHGVAQVTARPGRALEAAALLERELRRFLEHGPTAGELAITVAEIRAGLDQAVAKAANRTNSQLAAALYASVRDGEVFMNPAQQRELVAPWLDELEAEAIRAAFAAGFDGTREVLALTGREDIGDEAEARLLAAWTTSASEPVDPPLESDDDAWAYDQPGAAVDEVPAVDELAHGIRSVRLANNVQLAVLPRSEQPGEVLLQLRLHGDPRPLRAGLTEFTAAGFMAGGLGAHDAPALRRVLAGTTAGVSGPGYDSGDVVFSASCQPQELALCLQQLRAWLTDPGWRPQGFARAHDAWLERLIAAQRDLDYAVSQRWSGLTAGGYPQRRPATVPEAAWMHLGAARAWLSPILQEAPIELAIVGDVEAEAAIEAVATWFGSLPPRPLVPVVADLDAAGALAPVATAPTGEIRFDVDGSVARAVVLMAWRTDDAGDVGRARRLGLLAQVVDELLRRRIREELGEAYSPYARHTASTDYEGEGYLLCRVGVAPGREDAVVEVIRELIAELRSTGIADDVFAQAHTPTVANLAAYRHRNGYWLRSVVAQAHSQPQRLDWAEQMVADFAAIDKLELEAMARAYLVDERRVTLVAVSYGTDSAAPGPEEAVAP